ncbi:hypothetical protein [Erysipelothrix larvae]|uniref:hypothetical protein n=1 Tax=Erysipelothrix larvae TaxID=1514105 RepID=UPI000AB67AC7|nr:hypothetical protein [Erysipelothrix larvae]
MTDLQVYGSIALALVVLLAVKRKIKKMVFRTILIALIVGAGVYLYLNGMPQFNL